MKVFQAISGGLALAALASPAQAAPETYRCLEMTPNTDQPSFSMGIAVSAAASSGSLGAVTLIKTADQGTEANFKIEALRRDEDHLELEVRPVSATAESLGLSTLKIRPSGRAESSAIFQNKPVTLSCSRQFL